MRRAGHASLAAVAALAAAAGTVVWSGKPAVVPAPQGTDTTATERVAGHTPAASSARTPTLYCEFNNFADQTPLVGFYFRIEAARAPPVYALVSQREQDGSEVGFEGEGGSPPRWTFDGAGSPAVIRAPEDGTRINLYDYDPGRPGTYWFEAGLRSVRYRNLGGRCRHTA